jgi:dipeptidyl aminopeptidase/acylaminoacyl peptidase
MLLRRAALLVAVLAAFLCIVPARAAEEVPLIPRDLLMGLAGRLGPQLSPDGRFLAYIAADSGVPNVWVRSVGKEDDRDLTRARIRGVASFAWEPGSRRILVQQFTGAAKAEHILAYPLSGGEAVDLTPIPKVRAQLIGIEDQHPNEALIAVYDRDWMYGDVYRLNLQTAERTLEVTNDIHASRWFADRSLKVRMALINPQTGGSILKLREGGEWKDLFTFGASGDFSQVLPRFAGDDNSVYLITNLDSPTMELRLLNLETKEQKVVASDPNADIVNVLPQPGTNKVQAVLYNRARHDWVVLDSSIQKDIDVLAKLGGGDFVVVGRNETDQVWLISYTPERGPAEYYTYAREKGTLTKAFSSRPELEGLPMAEVKPIQFQARDGLALGGYLTLPVGSSGKNLPTVVLVRDVPWARDSWDFNPEVQWLANRGYACLQINFRGSAGFGRDFIDAGDREWGGKMQDDLTDGVNWLIAQGVADPKKIGIFGRGYGGYAALSGLVNTPNLFACAVSMNGPVSLTSYVQAMPQSQRAVFERRVGNPDTDSQMLTSHSPLFSADKIKAPLFLCLGAADQRIRGTEIYQLRDLAKASGTKVVYMEFPDEGPVVLRPDNRVKFYTAVEKFLAENLGGRQEATPQ